jgi:hypothetical protein
MTLFGGMRLDFGRGTDLCLQGHRRPDHFSDPRADRRGACELGIPGQGLRWDA